jgi:hypothetical protein
MFLDPASVCNPIRNGCKASSLSSICYLGSVLEPNLLHSLKTQSVSIFQPRILLGAVFPWSRILNFGQKFEIVSFLQSVQLRIPAAFVKLDKTYLLNH